MAKQMPGFTPGQLESICRVLGHTSTGFSGSDIGHFLSQIGVVDEAPTMTKWKRLYNALAGRQNSDHSGDRVFAFIACAMEPARFLNRTGEYHSMISDINISLSYVGFKFQEDGKFHKCNSATTNSEAHARADRLRTQLSQRNIHPEVLEFCKAELLQNDCFHAVLEASKSVAAKIRGITGLTTDGAKLVQEALGGGKPILLINAYLTDTEQGEQRGFVNLATGLFGTFRNPSAHEARIRWPLSEEDSLDLFSLASYVHRRIDRAALNQK